MLIFKEPSSHGGDPSSTGTGKGFAKRSDGQGTKQRTRSLLQSAKSWRLVFIFGVGIDHFSTTQHHSLPHSMLKCGSLATFSDVVYPSGIVRDVLWRIVGCREDW